MRNNEQNSRDDRSQEEVGRRDATKSRRPAEDGGAAFFDVDGLAEFLGVKPCFIRRLAWERRIPYHKIGKFIRFYRDEILAWIETCRIDPLR